MDKIRYVGTGDSWIPFSGLHKNIPELPSDSILLETDK